MKEFFTECLMLTPCLSLKTVFCYPPLVFKKNTVSSTLSHYLPHSPNPLKRHLQDKSGSFTEGCFGQEEGGRV